MATMEVVRPGVGRQGGVDTGCPAEEGVGEEAVQAVEVEVCLVGSEEEEKVEGASAAAARDSAHLG